MPTDEEITYILERHEADGWTRQDNEMYRGVVSADGRWYRGWDRATGLGFYADLRWMKDLGLDAETDDE